MAIHTWPLEDAKELLKTLQTAYEQCNELSDRLPNTYEVQIVDQIAHDIDLAAHHLVKVIEKRS